MTVGKLYSSWPGADDRAVIEEMLRDLTSEQWYECRIFVRERVQMQANNISQDDWDDIVQEVMIRINKYLVTFEHKCRLKTWIIGIVRHCIIDYYRKIPPPGQFVSLPDDPHEDAEHESTAFSVKNTHTAEDVFIMRDDVRNALAALDEYVALHKNAVRNRQILDMVLRDGRSHAEAAQAVGCSAPVASHVVREAQRYAREKLA